MGEVTENMSVKQNSKNKIPCLFFALIIILSSFLFAGCHGGDANGPNNSVDTQKPNQNIPNDPDFKYDEVREYDWSGADFVLLCATGSENSDVFSLEESMADEYDKQIVKRNEALCTKLNITLKSKMVEDVADYLIKADKAEEAPDLVYSNGGGGMSELMLYGCLDDLYKYNDQSTTALGVSVSVVRQLSVYEKLYMLTGAPIRSSVERAYVVAYNTQMLRRIGYEDGYLCELVLDGEWTVDKMNALAKQAQSMIDDDGFVSVAGTDASLYRMWQGLGAKTVEKLNGDVPSVSVYSPKNLFYFECVNHFSDNIGVADKGEHSLFYVGSVWEATENYNCDFGILPMPSYNNDGEYTCVLDFENTYFTALPKAADNKQMSLDFLTEFYALSVDTVYPIITNRSFYKNQQVLDVILKSRYFDFLDMYGIGHIVSTAFYAQTDTDDFDSLLSTRSKFAAEALDIAIRQTVG